MNFWIFGDSFGIPNDVTEYYQELKSLYPTIPDRQDIIGSEWIRHIATHLGYDYNDDYNLCGYGKSADWYLMRLYRMIHKGAIRPGDFVLITATAETRFEYSDNIDKKYKFNDFNPHLKTFQNIFSAASAGPQPPQVPSCLQSYMTLYQDHTWLAHLHLMKHEMVKGYLHNLGIDNMIVQGIGCRNDELPDNSLGWGKHPSPYILIDETMSNHGIADDHSFLTYMAFTNHLEPKQNKIYAEQLLEFHKY